MSERQRCTCAHCGHAFESAPVAGHKILCGDSTRAEDVTRLIGGETIGATVTDPPYSVAYDRSDAERGGRAAAHAPYHDGDVASVLAFLAVLPSDVLVMTYPVDRHFFALADGLRAAGIEVRKELVWVKDRFSFWPGAQYQQRHEPILVCARAGKPVGSDVPANESTVFEVPAPRAHELHATAKPIDLWNRLVKYHVAAGDVVYDPFAGSGTTIIAAEQLGRRCFSIELEPAYVDVAVRRWEEHTGRKAEKEML